MQNSSLRGILHLSQDILQYGLLVLARRAGDLLEVRSWINQDKEGFTRYTRQLPEGAQKQAFQEAQEKLTQVKN